MTDLESGTVKFNHKPVTVRKSSVCGPCSKQLSEVEYSNAGGATGGASTARPIHEMSTTPGEMTQSRFLRETTPLITPATLVIHRFWVRAGVAPLSKMMLAMAPSGIVRANAKHATKRVDTWIILRLPV
jgi:hypothetical protein